MVVDRGGLRYEITVPFDPKGTELFRAEIAASQAAWAAFKAEVESTAASTRGLRSQLAGIANATRDAAQANEESAAASRAAADAAAGLSAEERKLRRDIRRSEVSIGARNLAAEQGIDIYTRLTAGATEQQAVEEALLKTIQRAARAEAVRAQLARQGLDARGRTIQQFNAEAEALRRVEAASRRLAVTQALLARGFDSRGNAIRQFNAETVAAERAAKAERELAVARALAAKGLDTRGRKVEEFNAEAIAAERAAKAQQELAVREALAARGLDVRGNKIAEFNAEAVAAEKVAKATQQLAVARALAAKGFDPSGNRIKQFNAEEAAARRLTETIQRLQVELAFKQAAEGSKELRDLQKELKGTESQANRVAFTFRRLFGILAAFTVARLIVQGFRDIVAQAVLFNAKIEQSVLGVATLLTAVGDVRDATGATVTPARQLALAQAEARNQTRLLRLEALQTAATFEQLVDTFQNALGPGLAAGLNVDQVRKFAVEISQAAAAIGVAQNQLAEEIRSILTGTIQARTTRIATVLGITNEDIRNAKEAGVLVEFLNAKFQAFSEAGQESLNLFTVIASNLKDALLQLTGEGSLEFFKELKALFQDIQASVIKISNQGILVNPEAQKVVNAIFNGLTVAVREAQKLREALGIKDLLFLAEGIGKALAIAAVTVGTIIQGVIKGIATLGNLIQSIAAPLKNIGDGLANAINLEGFRQLFVLVLQIATVFGGFKLLLSGLVSLGTLLLAPFKLLLSTGTALVKTFGTVLTIIRSISLASIGTVLPYIAIGVALFAIIVLLKKWIDSLVGVELKFGTIVKIVKVTLVNVIKAAARIFETAFKTAIGAIDIAFAGIVGGFKKGIEGVLIAVRGVARFFGAELESLNTAIDKLHQSADQDFGAAKSDAAAIAKSFQDAQKALDEAGQNIREGVNEAIANNEAADTLGDLLKGVAKSFGDQLKDAFGVADFGIETQVDESKKLSQVFEELPGVIGKSNTQLTETGRIIKDLTEDLIEASGEFQIAILTAGLSSTAQKQVEGVLNAQLKAQTKFLELSTARTDAENRLLDIKKETFDLAQKVANLEDFGQLELTLESVDLGEKQLKLQREADEAKEQVLLTQGLLNRAVERGIAEEIQAREIAAKAARKNLENTQRALDQQKKLADEIFAGVDPKDAERITELARQILTIKGEDKTVSGELIDIQERRVEVEDLIRQAIEARLGALAAREIPALQREVALQETQLENARTLARFAESRLRPQDDLGAQTAAAEAQVRLQETELRLSQQQAAVDEAALQKQIQATQDSTTKILLENELALLREKNLLTLNAQTLAIQQQKQTVQELKQIAADPISSGIFIGIKEFAETTGSAAVQTAKIVQGAIQSLASEITGVLTDAIFSEDDSKTLKDRFKDFFKALIAQIIQAIIVAAILNILLPGAGATGAVPAVGTLLSGGGGQASAKGGKIKGGRLPAGRGHFEPGVQGLARGGRIRNRNATKPPVGVDPRDRIPVWARIGEWFITPEAVRHVGERFMRALNERRIDPLAAQQAIDAPPTFKAIREPLKFSFATGGPVQAPAGPQTAPPGPSRTFPQGDNRERSSDVPVRAAVVADEQNFDRLLTSGSGALIRWIEANSNRVNAALGKQFG